MRVRFTSLQEPPLLVPVSTDDRRAGLNGRVDGIRGTGDVQPISQTLKEVVFFNKQENLLPRFFKR